MLALSLRRGEVIYLELPDGAVGTVALVAGNPDRVRLGFTFPAAVKIHREAIVPADVKARAKQPTETV